MFKVNTYLKNFTVLLSGNVVAQIIPFLFAPFLSRIFTTEEFAIQANFMAIVGIIAIVAGGRYELAVVLPKSSKKAANLIGLAIAITVITSVLSTSLILFSSQIEYLYETKELSKFLPFIAVGILLSSLIAILTNWLVRKQQYRSISFLKIIQSISINAITIFFGYLNFGTEGLIFGWIIGQIISFVFLFYAFKKGFSFSEINKTEMKSVAKEYKDFPLVNSFHAFADLFFSQFVLFTLITREFGLAYLGLFFMMNKYLKAPIRVIGSAVGQIYYKEANEKYVNKENVFETLIHSVKMVSYFAVPICLIILFFGPEMFSLYLGKEWRLSGEYAQIMAIPILFNFLVSPISSTTLIYRKQKRALTISLVGYALSIFAFEVGVYLGWDFAQSLMLFAFAMSMYYIYLLFWYISLTRK